MKKLMFAAVVVATMATIAVPVRLSFGIPATGDGGHGFGVLAEYGAGGPHKVVITRRTAYDNPAATSPNYFRRWGTLCSLRVYGPDGFLAAYLEMGDQRVKEQTYEVEIPEGAAGIWRFSVSGGFIAAGGAKGDEFDFTIPETPAWGVRGEKRLQVLAGWPGCRFLPAGQIILATKNTKITKKTPRPLRLCVRQIILLIL